MDKLFVRSQLAKMIVGGILTALMISVGMYAVLGLLEFSLNPAIVGIIAVIGAAIYAAGIRK